MFRLNPYKNWSFAIQGTLFNIQNAHERFQPNDKSGACCGTKPLGWTSLAHWWTLDVSTHVQEAELINMCRFGVLFALARPGSPYPKRRSEKLDKHGWVPASRWFSAPLCLASKLSPGRAQCRCVLCCWEVGTEQLFHTWEPSNQKHPNCLQNAIRMITPYKNYYQQNPPHTHLLMPVKHSWPWLLYFLLC